MITSVKDLEIGVFATVSLIGSSYFRFGLDKWFFPYFLQDKILIALFLNGFGAFFSAIIFFFYFKRFNLFYLCILVGFSYSCFTHLQFLDLNDFGYIHNNDKLYQAANVALNALYSILWIIIGYCALAKFRSEYPKLFSTLGGKT